MRKGLKVAFIGCGAMARHHVQALSSVTALDLGASTVTLEGLGHWWMFEGCKTAADALVGHWEAA